MIFSNSKNEILKVIDTENQPTDKKDSDEKEHIPKRQLDPNYGLLYSQPQNKGSKAPVWRGRFNYENQMILLSGWPKKDKEQKMYISLNASVYKKEGPPLFENEMEQGNKSLYSSIGNGALWSVPHGDSSRKTPNFRGNLLLDKVKIQLSGWMYVPEKTKHLEKNSGYCISLHGTVPYQTSEEDDQQLLKRLSNEDS